MVHAEFKKLDEENVINLNAKKRDLMIDFLSCYPEIITKSASHVAVSSGFIDNSMIDSRSSSYPYMHAIIKTCKTKEFTHKYEQIIKDNSTALYEEHYKFGMISDALLEGFDFYLDRTYIGSIVSITSE